MFHQSFCQTSVGSLKPITADCPVDVLKTATLPDPKEFKNISAIHLTYVKPFWFDWQEDDHVSEIMTKLNLKYFCYATPFTADGAAHGSIKTQQKRKTFLEVQTRLPTFIGKKRR